MRETLLRLTFHLLRVARSRTSSGSPTFLILQYRIPLGCCIHGTPIYAALKAVYPGCILIVATHSLGYAVLQHDPHIDHLLDTDDPGHSISSLLNHTFKLRDRLRALALRPTRILQDASNRRGTLALFASLLRLAPTTGFADMPELYDTHLMYDPGQSLISNNLRVVGKGTPHQEPAVYFTTEDLSAAQSLLREVNEDGHPLTAIVVQGSGAQPNNWHDDRYAALIRHVESLGHRIVFLGTHAEAAHIDRVRKIANTAGHSLAGRTSIPQLAALLCLCDTLITVDTGTMHMGRAAGVPTLVLAPTWQPAIEWLPLDVPTAIVLRGEDRNGIPENYRLDEIDVPTAIAAFDQLTKSFPASTSAREQRIARLLSNVRA
jgi:ADP-heptose:LPS heptosyltransferase